VREGLNLQNDCTSQPQKLSQPEPRTFLFQKREQSDGMRLKAEKHPENLAVALGPRSKMTFLLIDAKT
jgi:hypothetical protein